MVMDIDTSHQIKYLYISGEGIKDISSKLKISRSTVVAHLTKMNLYRKSKPSPINTSELIKDYLQTKSIYKTAKKFHIDYYKAKKILIAQGVSITVRSHSKRARD